MQNDDNSVQTDDIFDDPEQVQEELRKVAEAYAKFQERQLEIKKKKEHGLQEVMREAEQQKIDAIKKRLKSDKEE